MTLLSLCCTSKVVCACAGLAAVFAASAAARLTHPQWYAELAHDACPNGLAAGLIRLTGATLIPIAAALWTLKVLHLKHYGAGSAYRATLFLHKSINLQTTLLQRALGRWEECCVLMQGAAEHDRLASNTYRRLNLGLAAWAAANLTLLAKGAAAHVVTWCSG